MRHPNRKGGWLHVASKPTSNTTEVAFGSDIANAKLAVRDSVTASAIPC